MIETVQQSIESVDSEKRGRILFLAVIVTSILFLSKVLGFVSLDSEIKTYGFALLFFAIAFVGQIWAFKFQIKFKSLLILFQSSLYVFSEVLFVYFFFFQNFSRIYEAFLLSLVMILIFVTTYVSFLMANVFNVGLFKKLPLIQVAQTSSYVLSLLSLYFLTFSFLASEFPIYILIPSIFICYFLIIFIHLRHLEMEASVMWSRVILIFLIMSVLFLGSFFVGSIHEVVSIVPAVGYLIGIGVISKEGFSDKSNLFINSLVFVLIILLNLFVNL